MVNIQIISDLHLEHRNGQVNYNDFIIPNKTNILVLVGDIGSPYDSKLTNFLGWCSANFLQVLYVPGNHEFYTNIKEHTYDVILRELDRICRCYPNVHLLHNKTYDVENVRFIGSILWTDIPVEKQDYIQNCMTDYRLIYSQPHKTITAKEVSVEFSKNRLFLEQSIIKAKTQNKRVVVLTHHAPSFQKTSPPQFENNDSKYGFASSLPCHTGSIDLWCCGHTHYNFCHSLEGYKLISNQIGYDKPVKGYQKDLIISI